MIPELYICPFCQRAGTTTKKDMGWFRSDPKPSILNCSACKEHWYEFCTDLDLPAFIVGRDAYEELRRKLMPDFDPIQVFSTIRDGDKFMIKSILISSYPDELIEQIEHWLRLNEIANPRRPKLT